MWIVFVLLLCGQGCVDIRAVHVPDEITCVRYETGNRHAVAFCEWRER